jgi:ATP adenylyltransferase
MIHVADLESSRVYLLNDQANYGRCVVALKEHRTELFYLETACLHDFISEVSAVARAIASVTSCQKMNYGMYGDKADHLHVHLVPKSPTQPYWDQAFPLSSENPVAIGEEELDRLRGQIRALLHPDFYPS